LLFKYVGPDSVPKVLESARELSIRFGLPRTYNDPYELFLEPDPPLKDEEQRAFYNYFLGKVVEAPAACFSGCADGGAADGRRCDGGRAGAAGKRDSK
jgi:hypothetical protein